MDLIYGALGYSQYIRLSKHDRKSRKVAILLDKLVVMSNSFIVPPIGPPPLPQASET